MGAPGFGNVANLKPPWKPGNSAPRRSRDVDKALRLARKHTPDAIRFAAGVLNDATEDMRYRLKAAEIILSAGLPKDPDAINKALGESDGPRYLEIVFVKPGELIEHQPEPSGNGNGTFSVSFDEPAQRRVGQWHVGTDRRRPGRRGGVDGAPSGSR